MSEIRPTSAREVATALRDCAANGTSIRIRGLGTRGRLCVTPPAGAAIVSLQAMSAIERLEPDDLTCSTQPGVTCRELADALARANLELDCLEADDPGTIGGLYASDPLPAASPHAASPRSTLLGIEGALTEGIEFRSGARVVKSVAGFDVHRLLVGSRGRLFAATLLHLKLRPAPRAKVAFESAPSDLAAAAQLWHALRVDASSPKRLLLVRENGAASVRGIATGRPRPVASLLSRHGLREAGAAPRAHLPSPSPARELVVGCVRPSRLLELANALPADAPLLAHGGGHFETSLEPARSDALFAAMPRIGGHAAVALGATSRIGVGTRLDAGAERLQRELRSALDPRALLA